MSKHLFLNNYKLDFLHQFPNRKRDISAGWSDWKTKFFAPSIKIPMVRNFKKSLL